MITKHKIQAFTLSEMIVVIILTSIVVGMAFSVLTLVQRHMSGIQNNFNKNTELNILEQSIWLDFNRYSEIEYNMINDELIFTSDVKTTTYKFATDYIVKELDTFNISTHNKLLFFDGDKTTNGRVDAIKFETSKTFQNQPVFVFKQNDANQFMN